MFPNNVRVRGLTVTVAELAGGAEVLIGMDVITCGDFCISHPNGATKMTWQCPSMGDFDFVRDAQEADRQKAERALQRGARGQGRRGRKSTT